ncbi:bifunctional 2-polyprenyl-6-hydroxyphenol methylase/3-demethylubiquinol 3-O-methyltransferase UbiG [Comamonas sp. 26]|uniref:class I SAM-dependent methyltransferase n=1 Tax=Comamonas sp. 26 TaxID=2035201 RepID=UPI000C38B4F1|nr:methyltransferase family protein [Comamonas sp. 26]
MPGAQPSTMPLPSTTAAHGAQAPSAWITRFAHLLRPQGTVLDLACGMGRHTRYFFEANHALTSVDKSQEATQSIADIAETITADIENGPWPLADRSFDGVVITNYLWRPLWPQILASVKPGGVLLYETFGQGNEAYGKPSRPDFLLVSGELLQVCAGWSIVAYEHGVLYQPDRVVQRIAAIKPADSAATTAFPLQS